jgi:hypothetical protein
MVERLTHIENTIKEILNWIKLGNKPLLREILIRELDSDEKKRVYELTDGNRSQIEIEVLTKVSRRMVGYYWQKWYGLGILVPSDRRKGRMQKIVSLDEIAINVTLTSDKQEETSETEFQSKNLKDVLNNQRIFPNTSQLIDFALSILPPPLRAYQNLSHQDLIEEIIDTFEKADKMKQNLFLQALERRAVERQNTEFSKFFDAWARQIGK